MAKVQTSALIGPALDWAVAKCVSPANWMVGMHQDNKDQWRVTLHGERGNYTPSTDWAQGGPLKEREGIVSGSSVKGDFFAFKPVKDADSIKDFGPTELVAAMRCLVALKLGGEVDVPEELAE